MISIIPRRAVLLYYLTRSLIGRCVICGGVLVSMTEILNLLEMTTPILQRHLGAMGLLHYALLRLPSLCIQTIPLSTLIGTLFMLMQMTVTSEIASLRASGLSTWRLLILLLPSVGIISIAGIFLQEVIAPRTELALARWWNQTDPHAASSGRGFWFHAAGNIVHIDSFTEGGQRIQGITVYYRTSEGDLKATDTAIDVSYDRKVGWQAPLVRRLVMARNRVETVIRNNVTLLPTDVTPDTLIQLSQVYPVLSSWSLWKILYREGVTSLPIAMYRMAFYMPFILPVSLVAMLLLALPVIYIPPRTGTRSLLPVASLGAGFGFIVVQGLIQALGNAGTLPALIAVMAPPALAFLLGGAWIVKMEEK